jgi:hypothetical protein
MRKIWTPLLLAVLAGCSTTAGSRLEPTVPVSTSDAGAASPMLTRASAAPLYVLHGTAWNTPNFIIGIYADYGTSVSNRIGVLNLSNAIQVAVDRMGRVYVLEDVSADSKTLAVYSPWAKQLLYTIPLSDAWNISLDASCNLYVQYGTGYPYLVQAIDEYNPGSSSPRRTVILGQYTGVGPAVVAPSGEIYVPSGSGNNLNVNVYPPGHTKVAYSFVVPGQNAYGWEYAVDSHNNFYAGDISPSIVEYPAGSTSPSNTLTTGSEIPVRITFDENNDAYVADSDGTILYFPAGNTTPAYTIPAYSQSVPVASMATDPFGGLFVAYGDANKLVLYQAGSTTGQSIVGKMYWDPQAAVGPLHR